MGDEARAKRYYISGSVQGVGYRHFVHMMAARLGVAGFARNLRDGRVEVYAIGQTKLLAELRVALGRGPSLASVSGVTEEDVEILSRYAGGFSIEYDV